MGARRIDARVAQVGGASSPWQPLATLGAVPDASIDELVSVAAFCDARELAPVIETARRVLAPGGRLHFLEHVGRPGALGVLQKLSDPMWASLPNGCHVDHDLVAALRSCGFVVIDLERCTVPSVVPFLRHWVQGVAMVSD